MVHGALRGAVCKIRRIKETPMWNNLFPPVVCSSDSSRIRETNHLMRLWDAKQYSAMIMNRV